LKISFNSSFLIYSLLIIFILSTRVQM